MPRFAAIEGLRGWLAWGVVLSHIAQVLGMGLHGGHEIWLDYAGEMGVMTNACRSCCKIGPPAESE